VPPVVFPDPFLKTSPPPHIVVLIPARYASTRLPGKPLSDIAGRPMIEHVYRRAAETPGIDAVVVATDDARIAIAVEQFGGIARMTHSAHRTGTDRIAEIVGGLACDIVVNLQGDLPRVEPQMIADAVAPLAADRDLLMSTLRCAITDPAEYSSPNVVKVVVDRIGDALYFSRAPVPYLRRDSPPRSGHDARWEGAPTHQTGMEAGPTAPQAGPSPSVFKHIGLYVYRREFLLEFAALPPTPLELAESLEQLRALEHGFRIHTVETQSESIEVDTPEDLERVRQLVMAAARG
jgi:3-deoxy-manno-octulosonate cytidylyltransferase (CMP-KDO synthetase)